MCAIVLARPALRSGPPPSGRAKEETVAMEGLTERERDVLRLLALQLSNEEIAETFGISRRTAETHVAHVVAKLGVANRREAGRLALGLLAERKDQ
ncbi:MAG: helix-turn-helix transcriptional regulator [Dehalococcoidia bacterium]|nr:helix-turn-helix transcriptional regulator [Dehalococcoidia bacterium]